MILTDVLLFSDIGLSLVHHYRVHKRGLPHIAFGRNYMSQLHALLPLPMVLPTAGVSPDSPNSSSMCTAGSPDAVVASPRTFQSSRFRIRWLRRGRWCSIVALRCCQFRWTSVVWTCRRFGLRQCQPGPWS